MRFKKILLLGYSGQGMEDEYRREMDSLTEKKIFIPADRVNFDHDLKQTDCLLVRLGAKVGREFIDKAPKLKYIGMLGTGVGGIDLKYAADKGITVCNIANYATEGVAEFTFGVILDYIRELEKAKVQARGGNYSESGFAGTEIKGKNFGVIGLGNIGLRTAELAIGFGAKVSYWSKHRKKQAENKGINFRKIEEVLKSSDIITLNISLNSESVGFLSRKLIQLIKKGALLVNPSPMELVDLEAIEEKLKAKEISFILDHSDEMTKEQLNKLKSIENCVIYPPIAYTTKEATALKKGIFINNLKNYLKGSPTNKVN